MKRSRGRKIQIYQKKIEIIETIEITEIIEREKEHNYLKKEKTKIIKIEKMIEDTIEITEKPGIIKIIETKDKKIHKI